MNLYDQSIATYRTRLDTLAALLTKAADHAEGESLLSAKLADDMHPLATQIRFVTVIPSETIRRLGMGKPASEDTDPASFAEAQSFIAQAKALMDGITPGDMPDPDARMTFSLGGGAYNFEMGAEEYVREFALPNLYFHLTSAYAILRMKGLEIGKADFIPHMMPYLTAGRAD